MHAGCENICRIIKTIASIWLWKYARIFVLGRHQFLVAHSFPRANCLLLGTDNVRGQISYFRAKWRLLYFLNLKSPAFVWNRRLIGDRGLLTRWNFLYFLNWLPNKVWGASGLYQARPPPLSTLYKWSVQCVKGGGLYSFRWWHKHIFFSHKDFNLLSEMCKLTQWCRANKLSINFLKNRISEFLGHAKGGKHLIYLFKLTTIRLIVWK